MCVRVCVVPDYQRKTQARLELPKVLQTGGNLLLPWVPVAHCMDEFTQIHASETGDRPKFLWRRFAANSRNSRIHAVDNSDMPAAGLISKLPWLGPVEDFFQAGVLWKPK